MLSRTSWIVLTLFMVGCAGKTPPASVAAAVSAEQAPGEAEKLPASTPVAQGNGNPVVEQSISPAEQVAIGLKDLMHNFWTIESRQAAARLCQESVESADERMLKFIERSCDKLENEDAAAYQTAVFEPIQGNWTYDPEKLTLVTYWELWCPHCKKALPNLELLRQQFEPSGLQVVGITKLSRGVGAEMVQAYATESQIQFPLLKGTKALEEQYGVLGVPDSMLLKGGKVIWRGHPAAVTAEVIEQALRW